MKENMCKDWLITADTQEQDLNVEVNIKDNEREELNDNIDDYEIEDIDITSWALGPLHLSEAIEEIILVENSDTN